MTSQLDGHDPAVDRPDDRAVDGVDDIGGSRWSRLSALEDQVLDALSDAGVPTTKRKHMQRNGRPAIAGHLVELAVINGRSQVDRLELLSAAEQAAQGAGKAVGAVVRRVGDQLIITLSLTGFAALVRAATTPEQRDEPVIEAWPNGEMPCSICGTVVRLRGAPRPGQLPVTCSDRCRTERTRRRKSTP